jgi:hypothetical protein
MSTRKHENPITLRLRSLPEGLPVKALAVAILFALFAVPGAEAGGLSGGGVGSKGSSNAAGGNN